MMIRTIYKDDEIILQKIIIRVGDCTHIRWREIKVENPLVVAEFKERPEWFVRQKKLDNLL